MTSPYFGLIFLLLAGACTAKTLDGGSTGDAGAAKREDAGRSEGGIGTRTAGESCDDTDGCIEGLACRDFAVHPTGQPCQVVGQQCTKECAAGAAGDAICKTLGPKYMCFKGCGEDYSCGNTL